MAKSLNNLGNVHKDLGEYDEAKGFYQRAIAITEKAMGPDHLTVAGVLGNLATVHMRMGEHEQAKAICEGVGSLAHEFGVGPPRSIPHPDPEPA